MKLKHFLTLLTICGIISLSNAQSKKDKPWNGKECAVVLTYDDGTNFHLDNVIPVMDSLGIKATFYIPGHSKCLSERLPEWRAAAENGHELGNHTIFHPCHGKSKNMKWVKPEYDLDNYTLKRITDEIKVNNTLLYAIDGKTKRTFAYTCGDTTAGDYSFVPMLKKEFIAARSVQRGLNYINDTDLYYIKCYSIHNEPTEDLINLIKSAQKEHALIVFLFHGVGGGSPYSISTEEHSKLVHYLKQNEDKFWIAPMIEVAEFIKRKQED